MRPESSFDFVFGFEEVSFHVVRGSTEWATWQETVGILYELRETLAQ